MVTADKLKVGDKLKTLVITVTPELNQQFLEAMDCDSSFYDYFVHPALLIGFSNITRSPSYKLDDGVAAIHVQDEIEFYGVGKVGDTFSIDWEVISTYHKRDKHWQDREYQVKEAIIRSGDKRIIQRRITDIFIRQDNT